MFQPKTEGAVLAGVKQFGPGIGAKKMMTWEFTHVTEGTVLARFGLN